MPHEADRRSRGISIRFIVVSAIALAGSGVAGWLLFNAPPSGADRLRLLPESALRYPGAEPLDDGWIDRSEDVLGTTSATWWMILGADASISDVLTFYDGELTARGWDAARPTVPSTNEVEAYKWTRGELRFRLGFLETEEWHQRIEGSDRWPTLYDMRIIEDLG